MVTVSGGATAAWPVRLPDNEADAEEMINAASYEHYFQNTQNPKEVITSFYNAGIDAIANVMTMNFGTWRMNYDSSVALGMGATHNLIKELRPTWSDTQAYQHVGMTPMIGIQDTSSGLEPYGPSREDDPAGSGYFTSETGVDNATFWSRKLKVGYLSFWSLGRDKPGTGVSGEFSGMNLPKYTYTEKFMQGLDLYQ